MVTKKKNMYLRLHRQYIGDDMNQNSMSVFLPVHSNIIQPAHPHYSLEMIYWYLC